MKSGNLPAGKVPTPAETKDEALDYSLPVFGKRVFCPHRQLCQRIVIGTCKDRVYMIGAAKGSGPCTAM